MRDYIRSSTFLLIYFLCSECHRRTHSKLNSNSLGSKAQNTTTVS